MKVHYAGTVSYNVTGWLEKNKDPVNDTVVDIMKRSTSSLLVHIWRDHPGQTFPESEEAKGGGSKKKKGTGDMTLILTSVTYSLLHRWKDCVQCVLGGPGCSNEHTQ